MVKLTFQLYLMKFQSAHFGSSLLEETQATFTADRLFSALFMEAMKYNLENEFYQLAVSDDFQLSDAMLYNNGLYFPKPIGYPLRNNIKRSDKNESRREAKKVKELNYLYEDDFDYFISGEAQLEDLEQFASEEKMLFTKEAKTSVGEDPYRIGTVHYESNTALAVIARQHALSDQLFESLQYSGLGGKRSSGLGQFKLEIAPLEDYLSERITTKSQEPLMLLTKAIANDNELEGVLEGSAYLLEKASGFAYSRAGKDNYRKQDLYKFKAGSTFQSSFEGTIIDVAPDEFPHPVWNYSKPLFLRLEGE